MKVSDFALMLELNKRTEQVAHLKEVTVQIVPMTKHAVLPGGFSLAVQNAARRTLAQARHLVPQPLPQSATAQGCLQVCCATLLSKIIVVLFHEAGAGTRRTGLELQVLQGTKELPLDGQRKLERFQQQTTKKLREALPPKALHCGY